MNRKGYIFEKKGKQSPTIKGSRKLFTVGDNYKRPSSYMLGVLPAVYF